MFRFFVVNIIKICIWLLLLSYSAVLIQGAATGKENKVKLIKDNIVFMIVIVVLMMKSDIKWLDLVTLILWVIIQYSNLSRSHRLFKYTKASHRALVAAHVPQRALPPHKPAGTLHCGSDKTGCIAGVGSYSTELHAVFVVLCVIFVMSFVCCIIVPCIMSTQGIVLHTDKIQLGRSYKM